MKSCVMQENPAGTMGKEGSLAAFLFSSAPLSSMGHGVGQAQPHKSIQSGSISNVSIRETFDISSRRSHAVSQIRPS